MQDPAFVGLPASWAVSGLAAHQGIATPRISGQERQTRPRHRRIWKDCVGTKDASMARYMWQGRSSWVPARYRVVHVPTGEIVSRHLSEAAGRDAALDMN